MCFQITPVAVVCIQQLAQILLVVCRNPTQPGFNHYLFESVAAIIRYSCAADPNMVGSCEELLFPAFQIVLQEDVQEFHPYVFQIFAQLIEARTPPLPAIYSQLFPPLLSPTFWERSGNIPALVRLLQVRKTTICLCDEKSCLVDGNVFQTCFLVAHPLLCYRTLLPQQNKHYTAMRQSFCAAAGLHHASAQPGYTRSLTGSARSFPETSGVKNP